MPMYEFECAGCGEQFEVLVRGTTAPSCPHCEGKELTRIVSSFAVNSPERVRATIRKAKREYQNNRNRQDQVRSEREEVREHVREDYGIDLGPPTPNRTDS